jgi:L-seryl-tRNA(Ser) seleniumtransferase
LIHDYRNEDNNMKRKNRLSRRNFVQAGVALPAAASSAAAAASAPRIFESAPVYERLGVRTFINAVGTITTFSGTLMSPEVKAAMDQASSNFVLIHELQEKAGKRIAELTGAEAAFVTAGASCALCLSTCAVTAGDDREKMRRLPDVTGMKDEIIIQKIHHTSYDHAFRMVGAKLVDVETAADIPKAINAKTAATAFVRSHHVMGHKVELDEYVEIAHKHNLPVILDAAAEVPPVENLSKFVKMGVDMVAFSGGKNIRGPQCSGILMGKKEWIDKAYANAAPANYLPRIAKVGKEEIIGLLTALELYLRQDHDAERREWYAKLNRIAEGLQGLPTVYTEFIPNNDFSHSPRLSVQWDEEKLGLSLKDMVQKLRDGNPSIEASDMRNFNPSWKGLGLFPYLLQPGEETIIANRIAAIVREHAS